MSWLNGKGKPQIAVATFIVPADSPNIVESKSFKLYLGSFAQTAFDSIDEVKAAIRADVSAVCGSTVSVQLVPPYEFSTKLRMEEFEGLSLDRLDLDAEIYSPDTSLLKAEFGETPVDETLYSNLLKSNCPVTGQPDWGSVQIRYVGVPIDHAGLLRYIISYREHTGFHEQCVEKIFLDIMNECKPKGWPFMLDIPGAADWISIRFGRILIYRCQIMRGWRGSDFCSWSLALSGGAPLR